MNVYKTDNIRNVVLLGHGGSGKTSMIEAMAYGTKITNRIGKVSDGNTISDYDKEEIKRGISIGTSVIPIEFMGVKINILDTPGSFDFVGEVEEAISVADAAVIVINCKSGIEVGTIKAWEICEKYHLPRLFYVSSFDDLVAAIALFRPGAMSNIDSYVRRKEGKEKITYLHEDLREILQSTYGIIIYQEQVMQIANVMAGYTLGEADILRRAMGKKSHEIMSNEKDKFIKRSINNGYSEEISKQVFDLIYKFADFGFNKSHSVGYSVVAFKMAYLKAHYPEYFMSHLLTMVIGNDQKTRAYINESKNEGLNISLPSINESQLNYIVNNNNIRFALPSIHDVGIAVSKEILTEREKGKFKDFFDFVKRCYSKVVNKKTIEHLIYAGCFDEFGYNHQTLINNLDIAINYAELVKDLDESLITVPEIEIYDEYDKDKLIIQEYQTFGFYLSYHPVQNYRKGDMNTTHIKENFNNKIGIYLLVDNIRVIKTKSGDKMAFMSASDEYGNIDCVMFPKTFIHNYSLNKGEIIYVNATVEKRINKYQLIINYVKRLS